jgi:pimeloyl-ACP methyl ester carboxylesterase
VTATGWTAEFVPSDAARRDELRAYRGFVRLLGPPVRQPPPGRPAVLLVPGFISGDVSLVCLGRSLRRAGLRTFRSRIGANLGCTEPMVSRLIRRLEAVAAAEGRPVALVGHSRGGMIVALAARRRPDLVAAVVVLAAPVTGSLSVAPHVRAQLDVLFRLNRRGLRWVLGEDCVTGHCADGVVRELASPFPASVPYTSVYSRNDAIIDWHACLDPAAERIEVTPGHTAMAVDAGVQQIVVERLAALR